MSVEGKCVMWHLEQDAFFHLFFKKSFHGIAWVSSCTSYFVKLQKVKFEGYIGWQSLSWYKPSKLGLFSVQLGALKEEPEELWQQIHKTTYFLQVTVWFFLIRRFLKVCEQQLNWKWFQYTVFFVNTLQLAKIFTFAMYILVQQKWGSSGRSQCCDTFLHCTKGKP